MNEGHLKEIFSEFGTVLRAFYPKNNRKYTIRRFGLVEFEKKSQAKNAILHMNEGWINGREVVVRFAQPGEGEETLEEQVLEKQPSLKTENRPEKSTRRSRSRSNERKNRDKLKGNDNREPRRKRVSKSSSSTKSIKEVPKKETQT